MILRSAIVLFIPMVITTVAVAASGCAHSPSAGGPLPQFTGAYRILQSAERADEPDVWPALRRVAELRKLMAMPNRAIGAVVVAPTLGGEYADWHVRLEEPDHEIRMIVGPRSSDGTYAVWRFEQAPAPRVRREGTGHLESDAFVAEFAFVDGDSSTFLRERWLAHQDRVEFALETRRGGATPSTRVGGFIAERD